MPIPDLRDWQMPESPTAYRCRERRNQRTFFQTEWLKYAPLGEGSTAEVRSSLASSSAAQALRSPQFQFGNRHRSTRKVSSCIVASTE